MNKFIIVSIILACVLGNAVAWEGDDEEDCCKGTTVNFNFDGLNPYDCCEYPECVEIPVEDCPNPCQECPECNCPGCYCAECPSCPSCPSCDSCCPEVTCADLDCCNTCEDAEGLLEECCEPVVCPPGQEIYTATDGDYHSFWFNCGKIARFSFVSGATLVNIDGNPNVLVLSGNLVRSQGTDDDCVPGSEYYTQIIMQEVDADGVNIKPAGADPTDWRFYEFISSEFTQTDCVDDCASYTVQVAPSLTSKPYAFQVGTGGSLKDVNEFGGSTWIDLVNQYSGNVHGDINIKLEQICPE